MSKAKYTRAEILDTAKEYVTKDRAATHGDMESNLTAISHLWSIYLDTLIKPHEVGVMMTLLKCARSMQNPEHADNYIDGAGYLSCSAELIASKPQSKSEPVVFQGGKT